jgi:hypothetical protein
MRGMTRLGIQVRVFTHPTPEAEWLRSCPHRPRDLTGADPGSSSSDPSRSRQR